MTYYRKYILSNPLALSSGRRLAFQSIGNDQGVLALDNPEVIAEVKTFLDRNIGGIMEITEQEYEELKKKAEPESPQRHSLSGPAQWPQYRVTQRGDLPPVAAAADPHVIPSPVQQAQLNAPLTASEPKISAPPAANRPVPRKLAKTGPAP